MFWEKNKNPSVKFFTLPYFNFLFILILLEIDFKNNKFYKIKF